MTTYKTSMKVGNIFAGETDHLWTPSTVRGGYGAILLHGSNAPNQFVNPSYWASSEIPAVLARNGIPCVAGTMGGQTFGNDTLLTRIGTAITYLGTLGVPTTKVHLIGVSMGAAGGIRYAKANPTLVASFTGIIPMSDINATYTANRLGLATAIASAWGVISPAALPAGANLASGGSAMSTVPSSLYYSTVDTTALPGEVTALGTAISAATVQSVDSTFGHAEETLKAVRDLGAGDFSTLVNFLVANGA